MRETVSCFLTMSRVPRLVVPFPVVETVVTDLPSSQKPSHYHNCPYYDTVVIVSGITSPKRGGGGGGEGCLTLPGGFVLGCWCSCVVSLVTAGGGSHEGTAEPQFARLMFFVVVRRVIARYEQSTRIGSPSMRLPLKCPVIVSWRARVTFFF